MYTSDFLRGTKSEDSLVHNWITRVSPTYDSSPLPVPVESYSPHDVYWGSTLLVQLHFHYNSLSDCLRFIIVFDGPIER